MCFQVPPGEYRLSAFAAVPESAPELLLSPPFVDLKVNSPTLNVKFHQVMFDCWGSEGSVYRRVLVFRINHIHSFNHFSYHVLL